MERRLRRLEAANADGAILAALRAAAVDEAERHDLAPEAVIAEALAILERHGGASVAGLAAFLAAGEPA